MEFIQTEKHKHLFTVKNIKTFLSLLISMDVEACNSVKFIYLLHSYPIFCPPKWGPKTAFIIVLSSIFYTNTHTNPVGRVG